MGPKEVWADVVDQLFSLDDLIDLIKRRMGLIAAVTLMGCLGSFFYALSQTHLYESTEVLQVVRPTIDDDLARSTVDGSSARRLQLIEQQLMTRDTILEIADQFGIFEDAPNMTISERVSRMRDSVMIRGIAAAREGFTEDGTVSALSITATFDSPEKAQGVAHEFAKRTVEISASSRIERARQTLRFFTEQENKLAADLDALEKQVAAYRRENDITIEGGLELRQTQIAAIAAAILDLERERITLEQELAQLDPTMRASTLEREQSDIRAQIAALDAQKSLLESRRSSLSQSIEVSPQVERDLNAFDRQREKIQDELDLISARRAEAEVGFRLEERRQAERLTVIEPALLPETPITPSRTRTAILGAFASLLMGLGAAFVMDLRQPVIRTARQMKSRVGITPVVTIPPLEPTRRESKRLAHAKIALAGHVHETGEAKDKR